jgi:hypothetical protein
MREAVLCFLDQLHNDRNHPFVEYEVSNGPIAPKIALQLLPLVHPDPPLTQPSSCSTPAKPQVPEGSLFDWARDFLATDSAVPPAHHHGEPAGCNTGSR